MQTRLKRIKFNLVNSTTITYDLLGAENMQAWLAQQAGKDYYELYVPEQMRGMIIPKDRVLTMEFELEDTDA
jgi:hypothetical protein